MSLDLSPGDWEKVSTEEGTDEAAVSEILKEYCFIKQWGGSLSSPPTLDNIVHYFPKSGHCEPGTDGAPPFCLEIWWGCRSQIYAGNF